MGVGFCITKTTVSRRNFWAQEWKEKFWNQIDEESKLSSITWKFKTTAISFLSGDSDTWDAGWLRK